MTKEEFQALVASVEPVDQTVVEAARARHDRLTKPAGSLGQLEALGARLAGVAGSCPPPLLTSPTIAVFAGDHGVVAEGVTPWPSEVTAQMVANFCHGGAAINVLARQIGATVMIVDVGVATPIPGDTSKLLARNVAKGTRNLAREAAMTLDEVYAALAVGAQVALDAVTAGADLLVAGDMGIGNTTASAALIARLADVAPRDATGRGTGIDDDTLVLKTAVIERALARLDRDADVYHVLGEVGGLEIAAMAGFIVAAAARRVPVVLDGVISVAAAMVAHAITPRVRDYLVAGHRSTEPGATIGLAFLGLEPLLNLGLRLGEGSGAALAVPLVQSAARILGEMATFDAAGVSERTTEQ